MERSGDGFVTGRYGAEAAAKTSGRLWRDCSVQPSSCRGLVQTHGPECAG